MFSAAVAATSKANPTGGAVVAGAAEISGGAGTLTIQQATARAILHWDDFSIGAGELVRFVQPDAASATLNRVLGGNASSLLGSLEANGQVFLINPNGVLIGREARVDAAGFLASTLNVANEQFLAGGEMVFAGDSTAAVQNLGAIDVQGGDIFLIARKVENRGTLSAESGTVGLAAGSEVLITTGGDQRVFVRAGTLPGDVVNTGEMAAATAELKAAGGNPYALAINNTGVVRANGTATRDGQIWLVAGTTDGLAGRASNTGELAASDAGGGGGFIETSGETVELAGAIRTGEGGRWLIDPTDVTIDAAAATTIVTSVNAGTDVTVEADNNITVAANVAANGTGDLSLKADIDRSGAGTVLFDPGIKVTNTGGGDVKIFYNPTNYAGPTNYASNVTVSGGGKFTAYMWVHDVDDLQAIATNLRGNYALSGNIDASETSEWGDGEGFAPLGSDPLTSSRRFEGVFDGQGHAISGLTINRPTTNYAGLFGAVGPSGQISDVTLAGGSVTGKSSVGMLAGRNSGMVERSHASGSVFGESNVGGLVGFVQEGSVSESSATGVVTGGSYAGGLVGFSNVSAIRESFATGAVSGTRAIGGLVGDNAGTSTVENSYATGVVTATETYAGGLVGDNSGTIRGSHAEGNVSGKSYFVGGLAGQSSGRISQSHATGNVEGENGYIGGLVGNNIGRISQSYASGDVSGSGDRMGGLVGANSSRIGQSYATGDVSGSGSMIGGLVGFSGELGGVDQSYATGVMTGGTSVGGLVGRANTGFTVTRSYWDADKTAEGGAVGSGAIGLTTADFQNGTLPAEFDERFWEASAGRYPVFKAILPVEPDNTLSGALADAGAGVALDLVIGGTKVASTTTDADGAFRFEYEGNFAQGATALVFVSEGGASGANRLVPLHSSLMGGIELEKGWMWVTSGASTLTALLTDWGNTLGSLTNDGILFSLEGGSLGLSEGIGLRLDLSATNFDFNTALDLTGRTMRLSTTTGFGVFTATGEMNFGTFIFERGQWTQNAATLPAFAAEDFRLEGGRFLRVTGGDGSEASPYLLADIYGLQGITSVGLTSHYALAADIDASGTAGWNDGAGFAPIGGALSFSGNFDGGGHRIAGLTIEQPGTSNIGLFKSLTGTVRDLGLVDVSVRGGSSTGGLIGWNDKGTVEGSYVHGSVTGDGADVGGVAGYNSGDIVGSHSTGTVTGADARVGGLVGDNRGVIDDSYSVAVVAGRVYAGGLVGWQANSGTITSSYAGGDVTGDSVGGLVGWNYGEIEDSFARGSVIAVGDYAGGLVAANYGSIRRSEASGTVQGEERLGGLVGYNVGEIVESHASGAVSGVGIAGGLVGWNTDDAAIRQSYATGDVSVTADSAGGIAGMNTGAIRQSYARGDVSAEGTNVGGLVGYHSGAISESYATGAVTGTGVWVGGLVGYSLPSVGTTDQSYWDKETTGRETSAAGTGLTTAELQSGALPTGFDPEVWDVTAGVYPILKGGAPAGAANLVTGTYAGVGEGVELTLAIDGQIVATTTTGAGGVFSFGFEGTVTENAPALVYVTDGGSHGANRVVPLQGWLTTNVGLLADWVWVTSRATTLSALLEEMQTAIGGLIGDGLLYSFDGDKPVLADGIGLRLETTAFYVTFDTELDLAGHALHLTGWTEYAADSALKAGTFILDGGGRWVQNKVELPEFAVEDFQIARGNFLRVAGGDGSEGSPWKLVDVYGLQGVAAGSSNAKHYVLGNDIDASSAANWNDGAGFNPIGDRVGNVPFQGRFDGAGHTLSNLTIDTDKSDVGLFSFIGDEGRVEDLILTDVDVRGASSVGALAGFNRGTIERVEVRNGQVRSLGSAGGLVAGNWGEIVESVASVSVTGASYVGGLTGENGQDGSIVRSEANGDVVATGYGYAGGLAGYNRLGGAIEESRATGDVEGVNSIGGLVGENAWGTIRRSIAEGSVTATGDDVGGLVGYNSETSILSHSYAMGAVKGVSRVGGLVGSNYGTIEQIYATGAVTGTSELGGLVGRNATGGTISNSYWDRETTGRTTSAGSDAANGLTTAEFRSGRLPDGFDASIWSVRAGEYPPLRWTLPPSLGNTVTGTLAGAGAGLDLTLVIDGVAVATTQTGASGGFIFDYAGDYVAGTTALIYVNGGGEFAANRLLSLEGTVTGGFVVDPGWVRAVSGAITLSELIEELRAARGALTADGLLYSVNDGALELTSGIGLRLDLTADHFNFDAAIDLTDRTLRVASTGTLTATASLHTGAFILAGGDWTQNAATLPEFTTGDFRLEGGRFLRVQGGDGTEEAPWQLVDIYGVQGVMTQAMTADYALVADIDASGTENWNDGAGFVPLWDAENYLGFSGVFDGRGHVISGLVINQPDSMWDVGLFSMVEGEPFDGNGHEGRILDVGLTGGRITGGEFAGAGGLAGSSFGTIRDSYVTGMTIDGSMSVGGLVGGNRGTIERSYVDAEVTGRDYGMNVGGLTGFNMGTIRFSYASGVVTGISDVGGLVGFNARLIESSYATASVTGTGANTGGLVGTSFGDITHTYATGLVTGADSASTGGLIGSGFEDLGSVTDSYWNKETTGQTASFGSPEDAGLTTAQMLSAASFAGWDIDSVGGSEDTWRIYEGATAPLLKTFLTPLTVTGKTVTVTYDGTATHALDTGDYLFSDAPKVGGVLGTGVYIAQGANAGGYSMDTDTLSLSGLYSHQQGYDLVFAGGSLTIAPKVLTAKLSGELSKIYDGTVAALLKPGDYELEGLVGSESFVVTQAAGSYDSANVADASVVTAMLSEDDFAAGEGTLASNYVLPTQASGAATITPRTVSVTAKDGTSTYGDTPADFGFTAEGLVDGETTAVLTGLSMDTSITGTTNAGDYTLSVVGTLTNGNYNVTARNDGTWVVSPKDITVTATGGASVYGDAELTNPGLTAEGLVNGETVAVLTGLESSFGITNTTNAGSHTLSVNGTLTNGNYNVTVRNDGTWVVSPKDIIVTANGGASVYGDADLTNPGFAADGLVNDETVAVLTGLENSFGITNTTNAGSHTLSVNGTLTNGNYNVTARHDGTWVVSPKNITVTATGGASVYGDADLTNPGFAADGLVNGETVAVLTGLENSFGITNTTKAGSHTLSVSGTLTNGNYHVTARNDGTWVVSPKDITVTANGGGSVYGDADLTNPGFAADGLVNGETVAVLTGLENSFGITNTTNAGNYALSVSGTLTNGNYNITVRNDGMWVVSPKDITVTANGGASVYGDADLTNPGFTADGLVNGETVAVLTGLENSFGITNTTNAGNYTLSVNGTLTNGNYNVTVRNDGTWVVSPKDITVTANGGASVYGDADVTNPGFAADGLVNDETVAVLTGLENSFGITNTTNAGNHTLSVNGTLTNGNYNVTARHDGTWVVSPKDITVTATGGASVYGDADLTNPGFAADGLVNGETVAVLTGLENSFGITNTTNAGNYTLSVNGTLTNGNYNVTVRNDGAWVVSPKDIIVTANGGASVYGDADLTNPGFTADGLVNGETVAVLTGLENSFGITNTTNAGSHTLAVSGTLTNGNYTVTARNDGTWVVSPKDIIVTANGGASVYGDADLTNPGFAADGLVNGETVAVLTGLENSFGITNTTNAGSHTLSVNGTLTNGNYNVTTRNDGTWVVSPKDIIVTASGGASVYGDADLTNPGFVADGLVNGETVAVLTGLENSFGITNTTNAGSHTLSVSGTLTNGNYNVTVRNDGTWVVSPKDITVTANGGASVYGDADVANPGFTADGLVNGETVAVLAGLENSFGITNTTNAGSHTLSVSGTLTNGNYNVTARNDGTWVVSPKDITVTAGAGSSVYGEAPAGVGLTADGLVNGETTAVLTGLSTDTPITATTNAGSYTLSVVGTLTNGNYNVTARHDGTWVVSPKEITVAAKGGASVYGDSGMSNPGFTADGLVNGETVAVLTGLENSFGITNTTNAGSHTLSVTGTLTNGNYKITTRQDGTWVVSPKDITVTANGGASVYGDSALTNPGFTADGLVNGETVAVLTGLENSFGITNTTNAGNHTLAVTGTLTNGNYNVVVRNDGTWVVSPRDITVTANGGTSVYGDVGVANPGFTADGLVNGETVAVLTGLENSFGITNTTNAGSYTLSVNGTLTNGNYKITTRQDGTWVVSPKDLIVTVDDVERGYNQPNPEFTARFDGLVNDDSADVVEGLVFSTPATIESPVGEYVVAASGGSARNYTLHYVDGQLTITRSGIEVDGTIAPVVDVDGAPAVSDNHAVVERGGRRTLVPLISENEGEGRSVEDAVTAELSRPPVPVFEPPEPSSAPSEEGVFRSDEEFVGEDGVLAQTTYSEFLDQEAAR